MNMMKVMKYMMLENMFIRIKNEKNKKKQKIKNKKEIKKTKRNKK